MTRECAIPGCPGDMGRLRADAKYCSKECRQAAWRFKRGLQRRERAAIPKRIAYADPPYPGMSDLYRDHPDYGGEVDHAELVSRLEPYDGWALSTSSDALRMVLDLCPPEARVAAWFRGPRKTPSSRPLRSWEPVIYVCPRDEVSRLQECDSLIHRARPRTTDPRRVIGAKPAAFCWWLFGLLQARPGDTFDDLYPGSGGVARAWDLYESAAGEPDASGLAACDTSLEVLADTSARLATIRRAIRVDVSGLAGVNASRGDGGDPSSSTSRDV